MTMVLTTAVSRGVIDVKYRRLVIVGSSGFVGGSILKASRNSEFETVGVSRSQIDLCTPNADQELAALLREDDAVIFCAADAPCKNLKSLEINLEIALCFVRAVAKKRIKYLVNISSDAVYQDSSNPIVESSPTAPNNWHGSMHSAREAILNATGIATLHLRPTLIYGSGDPHNGYGPNQFLSRARSGTDIELFGDGEELRDHVHITDVATAALGLLRVGATGALNVASGETRSFREIAERVVALSPVRIRIVNKPRPGPMPHGGLRPISIEKCCALLPGFVPMPVLQGVQREMSLNG